MLVEILCDIYFVPMVDDLDVYRRQARKSNVEDYYILRLVFVDDVL